MGRIRLNTDNGAKTIEEAFEEFQKSHRVRDLAKDTINSYEDSYRAFIKYYSGDNLCSSLNKQVMDNFILFLKDKGTVNNLSINSYLKNMRAFINFCIRLGYMDEFKVQLLSVEKNIKET